MAYLINSIPAWIRIFVLIICEIVMIYEYAKGKYKNELGKSFMTFLMVIDPVCILMMLLRRIEELGLIPSSYANISINICIAVILIGFWAVALVNVIKGNVPEPQRRIIIVSSVGFLLAVICFGVITILEKMQVLD